MPRPSSVNPNTPTLEPAVATMNIPNTLTVFRILLIPIFVGLLLYEHYGYSLLFLLIAGITDVLDGIIARVANQRTRLGAYLDPLADKLLLSSGFITLAILRLIPIWVALLVVSRDLILISGTVLVELTEDRLEIAPTVLGKITTVLQLIYLILVVFFSSRGLDLGNLDPLLYLMVASTLGSGLHYLYRGVITLGVPGA